LALRVGARIYVEECVFEAALEETPGETADLTRLQKWLEGLDEEQLGKYKM
jgi:hypothetical protein